MKKALALIAAVVCVGSLAGCVVARRYAAARRATVQHIAVAAPTNSFDLPRAAPSNSVDLPGVAKVRPEVRTANVDVTADCKFLTYTVRVDPGSTVYTDKDGEPPASFIMDASGSRSVAVPIGLHSATLGYDWTIARNFPDRLDQYELIAAGHVDCP